MARSSRWWLPAALALVLLGFGPSPAPGPRPGAGRTPGPPTSLNDPVFAELRRASVAWDLRAGPRRAVVDQVCLVADLAGFLEAVSAWDRDHYFPVLFDDAATTARFLRAFRPARVVRLPRRDAATTPTAPWDAALAAVMASWAAPGARPDPATGLDAIHPRPADKPPGVVLSAPGAPALAAGVALAAGRFQPLLRWDPAGHYADLPDAAAAAAFSERLTLDVGRRFPAIARLGDDCDFLTLAVDCPYRYLGTDRGALAMDDLLGRLPDGSRWAYAGRLLGDQAHAAYAAMCSLFLQPGSALFFNTYDDNHPDPQWATYDPRPAAARLEGFFPVAVRREGRADLAGWHQAVQPINRAGLILLNSSGGPEDFNTRAGPGQAGDIPPTVPAVVLPIHSYSAADPVDPATIAGRWLAQGAFLYYGSVNEPFLPAFRTPGLVCDMLAEGLPVVAAARKVLGEPMGEPWRLAFLGDPLYRLRRPRDAGPRLSRWAATADWPAYEATPRPAADAPGPAKVAWALKASIARWARDAAPAAGGDPVVDLLLGLDPARLDVTLGRLRLVLIADALTQAGRRAELRSVIAKAPAAGRPPEVRIWLESARMADLQAAIGRRDPAAAAAAWDELIRSDSSANLKRQVTDRLGAMVASSTGLANGWKRRLEAASKALGEAPDGAIVREAIGKVDARIRADPAR